MVTLENASFRDLVRHHAQISSDLPELLAQLVSLGKKEDAVNLLIQWGTHTRANSEVWKDAKELLGEIA